MKQKPRLEYGKWMSYQRNGIHHHYPEKSEADKEASRSISV
jgi:hypothetical protein